MENKLTRRILDEKLVAEKQMTIKSNDTSYWFGRYALASELLRIYNISKNKSVNIESNE